MPLVRASIFACFRLNIGVEGQCQARFSTFLLSAYTSVIFSDHFFKFALSGVAPPTGALEILKSV